MGWGLFELLLWLTRPIIRLWDWFDKLGQVTYAIVVFLFFCLVVFLAYLYLS